MYLIIAFIIGICTGAVAVHPKLKADNFSTSLSCPTMNPAPPITGEELWFGIVIQTTDSMRPVIEGLQAYIPQLIETLESQNPNYVKRYVIVSYDDTGATLLTAAHDTLITIGHIQGLQIKEGAVKCEKQLNQALIKALQFAGMSTPRFSSTFVFTDSPVDLSSMHDSLTVLKLLEQSRNKLSIFYSPSSPCQPLESSGVQRLFNLAEFANGQVYHTAASTVAMGEQFVNVMSNSYMTGRAYSRFEENCDWGRTAQIAVDSHTASMTVSVVGNYANILVIDPTGALYPLNNVLDDSKVVVNQAISRCAEWWSDFHTGMCFNSYESHPLNWNDANDHCRQLGGSLASVLNQNMQSIFDDPTQTYSVDFLIGLNDQRFPKTYVWNSDSIPLLSASYKNWAPSQDLSEDNGSYCVAMKYKPEIDNNKGMWYKVNCSTPMPYICQRPTLDFGENRLPSGNWTIKYGGGASLGSSCRMTVDVQSKVQVDWAFTIDGPGDDVGVSEPNSRRSNRVIASVFGGGRLTSVEFDWGKTGNQVIETLPFNERVGCRFSYYSTEFQCKQDTFNIVFHGTDDNGHRFTRQEYGICVGAPAPN